MFRKSLKWTKISVWRFSDRTQFFKRRHKKSLMNISNKTLLKEAWFLIVEVFLDNSGYYSHQSLGIALARSTCSRATNEDSVVTAQECFRIQRCSFLWSCNSKTKQTIKKQLGFYRTVWSQGANKLNYDVNKGDATHAKLSIEHPQIACANQSFFRQTTWKSGDVNVEAKALDLSALLEEWSGLRGFPDDLLKVLAGDCRK